MFYSKILSKIPRKLSVLNITISTVSKMLKTENKIKICEMFATDDIPHTLLLSVHMGEGGQPT